jgi:putative transposase
MAEAVRMMLNEAMKIECSQALGADPYQRSERRQVYANGLKPKTLETRLGSMTVHVPLVAEMYVQGVSTRKGAEVMEQLCGLEVSGTQVSRAAKLLDVPYLVLDARYEKVRHGGTVVSCAVLIAVGIGPDSPRALLGVSVSLSEAEVHWREFLGGLRDRGLRGVQMIVSDDHAGLKAARESRFAGVPWQRCQFHLQQRPRPNSPLGWRPTRPNA